MRARNLADWREKVLERDKHTCQDCRSTEKLIAHHIKSRFLFPKLRLLIQNGITLCGHCHTKRRGFALRLFYSECQGYITKFPTVEEVKAKEKLLAELASRLPMFRGSYHSRPYKIRKKGDDYWVTLPPIWVDRELRVCNVSLNGFVKQYIAIAHYYDNFDGVHYTFEKIKETK